MYLAARSWGIQPSEFWAMTMPEWMLEAEMHLSNTPEGRAMKKRSEWLQAAEMTDDEWWKAHGAAKN